ncbi:hypothetical protein RDWZM_005584 [Blomia tropicalis]|uniref:Protein kinase domain-containing protein n=1 Tax=Blomia tropicalis TaxID=40697 RepID=A0A9Q0M6E0_BLOTA|nr:hypothetical protein RDWZM_005584 [Blomia tropicalis]
MKRNLTLAFENNCFKNDKNWNHDEQLDSETIIDHHKDHILTKKKPVHFNDLNETETIIPKKTCQCNPYSPFIRAGPFILGTQLNDVQFVDLDQYIAKRVDETDPNRYFLLKIVVLPHRKEDESYSQRQAKLLLFNEYSVLSLLEDQNGVIHHKGLYMDYFYEEELTESPTEKTFDNIGGFDDTKYCTCISQSHIDDSTFNQPSLSSVGRESPTCNEHKSVDLNGTGNNNYSSKGQLMRRLILALECFIPHIYCSTVYPLPKLYSKFTTINAEYENLQEYVKRYKNIPELRALLIFKQIVNVIYDLHQRNIAHRDLRLENILFSHLSEKIVLVNFGLSRYVINDITRICDHRGSSAYISPDVLKRKPYNPKASDCWALGIIFYTMLFGKFPFYADSFPELFKKINSGQFTIPSNVHVWKNSFELAPLKTETHSIVISVETMNIIEALIVTDANKRLNITDLKYRIHRLLQYKYKMKDKLEKKRLLEKGRPTNDDLQVVPDINSAIQPTASKYERNSDSLSFKNSPINLAATAIHRLNQLVGETLTLQRLPSTPPPQPPTLTQLPFSTTHEQKNGILQLNTFEGIHHDHNYSQKELNKTRMNEQNTFLNYLQSKNVGESGTGLLSSVSMFSAQQGRFYYKDGLISIYSRKAKNNSGSLLLKHCSSTLDSMAIPSLANNGSSNSGRVTRQCSKGFVRLGSKMAKSNFSIHKIDGDIRPLNENEKNLFKQYTCRLNSQ